jgi:hypothetical protein
MAAASGISTHIDVAGALRAGLDKAAARQQNTGAVGLRGP